MMNILMWWMQRKDGTSRALLTINIPDGGHVAVNWMPGEGVPSYYSSPTWGEHEARILGWTQTLETDGYSLSSGPAVVHVMPPSSTTETALLSWFQGVVQPALLGLKAA
jgi:hypothetical protein